MTVNNNTRKLFHWALIVILAMAPLRGVMAMGSDCDMSETSHQSMVDQTMHTMHNSDDVSPGHDSLSQSQDCCCCDTAMACNSDCGVGISFSFIVQDIVTTVSIDHSRLVARVQDDLLMRAPTPPIRPPAYLQS